MARRFTRTKWFTVLLIVGSLILTTIAFSPQKKRVIKHNPAENLTEIPLALSQHKPGRYAYQSRWGNMSFSFPKDWVIRECQKTEDCEFHGAFLLYPKSEANELDKKTLLHLDFYTDGTSQCLKHRTSFIDSNTIPLSIIEKAFDKKLLNEEREIGLWIKYKDTCYEFLGRHHNSQDKDTISEILASLTLK